MITQSTQFMGCSARKLYEAYMSLAEHAAMTVDGTHATTFSRPDEGDVETGDVGDELRAIGPAGPDGTPQYSVANCSASDAPSVGRRPERLGRLRHSTEHMFTLYQMLEQQAGVDEVEPTGRGRLCRDVSLQDLQAIGRKRIEEAGIDVERSDCSGRCHEPGE